MVMGMLDGSGSSAGLPQGVMELMQRKMIMEMFGITSQEKPVDQAAEVLGSDASGTFGVIGIKLMPASPTQPFPRLTLQTNGELSISPDDLTLAAKFFQSVAERFSEGFSAEQERAKTLEGAELFSAMLDGGATS